jgi:hypothetical protein
MKVLRNILVVIAIGIIGTCLCMTVMVAAGNENKQPPTLIAAKTQTEKPTATPTIAKETSTPNPTATFSPTKPPTGGRTGYLWWTDSPATKIMVIASVHQETPANNEQAASWLLRGELCLAQPGAKYVSDDSVKAPLFTKGIEVTSGSSCIGFRGWVPIESLKRDPLP